VEVGRHYPQVSGEIAPAAGRAISRKFPAKSCRQVAEQNAERGGPLPLGIRILMKTDVPQKLANAIGNLEAGLIAPVEMITRAR